MFGVLFLKECKQVLRSLVYYIYVAVFVLFIASQMSSEEWGTLKEPVPGQPYYGEAATRDGDQIMEGTLENLMQEICWNSFATYPMGFYKGVTLTEEEAERIREILERCTGKRFEDLEAEREEYFGQDAWNRPEEADAYRIPVREGLTFEEFEASMEEVCRLVGRGSFYEKASYESRIYAPMTYEQAKEEFEGVCNQDRVTRAGMRLFCDYAGIVLAVLPIFVGVSAGLRDKRAKARQVIFSKPFSGAGVVVSRYLANLLMLYIPVVIAACYQQQPCCDSARALGVQGDIWAFLTVPGVWLMPEIMLVLALSFLLTELTDTILAVFVQVPWGIASLFGASTLVGNFGLKLVARWNTFGQTALFASQEKSFLINRGYYFLLAVVCVILTVIVFEKKRRKGGSVL